MKGFPNRKAKVLSQHWIKLKKEIATVTPLPEAMRARVAADVWTTQQSITLMELVKLVKDRRAAAHVAAVDPSDLSQAGASGRLWKAPGRMGKS